MKIKTRHIFALPRRHIASESLRTVTTYKMQLPNLIPHGVQTKEFEQDRNAQLIALDVERKQSIGRTYASMLPAR
jgi:hypothetical protein